MYESECNEEGRFYFKCNREHVVVKRRSGEVDVIPFCKEGNVWRIDQEHVVTIGYGNNTVEDSVADGDVTIMTF